MSKKEIVAKLDKLINSGSLSEQDKNELIQVKNEIVRITLLSEAASVVTTVLIRTIGSNFGFFE